MHLLCRLNLLSIVAFLCFLAVSTTTPAQVGNGEKGTNLADPSSKAESEALQKKASEAQARIRENESDVDQLVRAVKLNEVGLVKEILLRNGFTAKDLENAKINLLTGGGKGGEDKILISATCCDPKEITVQRNLPNFTK